ncbi:MAG: YwmB family TATA-box binding protein [Desulfitobacterium hafniense]|nr:YwmB family TATA-box binding protein [Desulfitobacterium hafniense]
MSRTRRIAVLLLLALILAFSGSQGDQSELSMNNPPPLLLDSGLTTEEQANLKAIILFNHKVATPELFLPKNGWEWKISEYTVPGKDVSRLTITGQKTVTKNTERASYIEYLNLAQEVKKLGGRAYLDERINEVIDISAYFTKTQIIPLQWAITDNVVSFAAYKKNGPHPVFAGKDKINVQIATRNRDKAQTVLAVPVLLEEF